MIGFFQSAKNERSSKRLAFLVGVIILFILIVFAFIFGIKEPVNIYNNCSLPKNYDCSILQGWRSNEEQEELFKAGRSKLRAKQSKHNYHPSFAVDVAPYPVDWENKERFYHFAGYVKGVADTIGIKIRWGGDWNNNNSFDDQTFDDLPHFELINKGF